MRCKGHEREGTLAGPFMFVRFMRALGAFALKALVYAALFAGVVLAHLFVTEALGAFNLPGAATQLISGAIVLALVLTTLALGAPRKRRRRKRREL